jgi:hypothetical protein
MIKYNANAANIMINAKDSCSEKIKNFYNIKDPIYADLIQIVRWFPGMEQPPHADDMTNTDVKGFEERAFGSIIYLNDNYSGGHTFYPNFNFEIIPCIEKIKNFNNVMINYQIETINESIKMISNKDTYFQSLLLKIFLDKFNKYANIIHYKNILYSRIQKCISFLKFYNINCHQIVYRISEN